MIQGRVNLSLNSKNKRVVINRTIRAHEIKEKDWGLQATAEEFYLWSDRFKKKFFNSELEAAVISFDSTNRRVMGHYVLGRNGIGVENNININAKHLDGKKWENLSTLLHEMTHQWQRCYGKRKERVQRQRCYHDKEFQQKMASFGLICDDRGRHTEPPKDPFVSFLKEYGVVVDVENNLVLEDFHADMILGQSKLKKFSCACDPVINIRVADKRFSGKCNHCGKDFKPAEASLVKGCSK
jgi:hypothetical protein